MEELALPPPAVEAVLDQVAGQVLVADAVEGPAQPSLEVRDHDVRPGQNLGRPRGLALDGGLVVHAGGGERGIAAPVVGENRT